MASRQLVVNGLFNGANGFKSVREWKDILVVDAGSGVALKNTRETSIKLEKAHSRDQALLYLLQSFQKIIPISFAKWHVLVSYLDNHVLQINTLYPFQLNEEAPVGSGKSVCRQFLFQIAQWHTNGKFMAIGGVENGITVVCFQEEYIVKVNFFEFLPDLNEQAILHRKVALLKGVGRIA